MVVPNSGCTVSTVDAFALPLRLIFSFHTIWFGENNTEIVWHQMVRGCGTKQMRPNRPSFCDRFARKFQSPLQASRHTRLKPIDLCKSDCLRLSPRNGALLKWDQHPRLDTAGIFEMAPVAHADFCQFSGPFPTRIIHRIKPL